MALQGLVQYQYNLESDPYSRENGTVTGESYRNKIAQYAFSRVWLSQQDYILQRDDVPSHYANSGRDYLET